MQATWSVTFELVTPESAEHGDAADRGFLLEAGTFREAIAAFNGSGYVEADSSPVTLRSAPRWLTTHDDQDYRDCSQESRSLHIPQHITPASRVRLARVLGCYGLR